MDSEPVARTQPGMRVASTAGSGLPGAGMLPAGRQTPGCPFRGRGLAARVLPFAVVAVLAEASLALPPGVTSEPAAIISVALLAATAAAFALPWGRLPGWAPVLMPLGYAGSVLALTIAAGSTSGVAIVALMLWCGRHCSTGGGRQAGPVQVAVADGDDASLTVTLPGSWPSAGQARSADGADSLREHARRIGGAVDIGAADGDTRLTWQLPARR